MCGAVYDTHLHPGESTSLGEKSKALRRGVEETSGVSVSSSTKSTDGAEASRNESVLRFRVGGLLLLGGDRDMTMGESPGLAGGEVNLKFRFSLTFFKHSCNMDGQ
jgi:hypothetical protein